MRCEQLERCYLDSKIVMKGDYPYFVNPISEGNPAVTKGLLEEITDSIIEISDLDCDIILTPEAMAIQYGAALTLRTGIPFQIIRKRGTGLPDEISFEKRTGYEGARMYISSIPEGSKVAIIDDVLSTGGTLRSTVKALREHGMIVTEIIIILNKSDNDKALSEELGIPIRVLLNVGVRDGKPVLR